MLIGLLSDTHIPDHVKELPSQLKQALHGVGLILHGGDIYTVSILDELECIAPVLAAEGDDDYLSTTKDRRVNKKHILNIEGVTIWLMHEPSWPPMPANEVPNVIIFGHTHEASLKNRGDVLLINPGSPTFPHYRLELGTIGLLTVNSGKAKAEIIQLQ